MSNTITIAGRRIGPGHAPFVIAECGINDGGSVGRADDLAQAAALSGCDAIKWQQHCAEESSDRHPWQAWSTVASAQIVAKEHRAAFGCTVFHSSARPRTMEPLDFWKIGSGEVSNHDLIATVATVAREQGTPVLLSTGMHTLSEVDAAVAILRDHAVPFAVLECTSTYPARHGEVRLSALAELRERYPDAVIGISDHNPDIWTALGAVALGACIVEKHFTVSRAWGGPDNPFSVEPAEMAQLCAGARAIHAATQSGLHRVTEAEEETARWARSGIYATRDIAEGEALSPGNVTCRRPRGEGAGGLLWRLYTAGNVRAPKAVKAGEPLA